MKPLREVKLVTIGAVMAFTAYPVIELTRCIVQYNIQPMLRAEASGAAMFWVTPFNEIPTLDNFYLELVIIWSLYLLIPLILNLIINLVYRMGMKSYLREKK